MNNENKHYCKTLFFVEEEIATIQDAILTAQNWWGDKKNGNADWDTTCQARIDRLEAIYKSIVTTHWKELPAPTKEI
jgi:hypothetical protein